MKEIELLEAAKHTSPNPVSLICTRTPAGVTNLGTVSWWTYLGLSPATIGFAMMKPSYSGEMTRRNKEAILVVPGVPLARHVMECGSTTGRDTDKARRFGIELMSVTGTEIEIPAHSVVAIHCSLREFVDVGDHNFYICDVKQVLANDDEKALFAWRGYAKIAPAVMA